MDDLVEAVVGLKGFFLKSWRAVASVVDFWIVSDLFVELNAVFAARPPLPPPYHLPNLNENNVITMQLDPHIMGVK